MWANTAFLLWYQRPLCPCVLINFADACLTLQDEDKAYIVQELCTGGTLHERLDTQGTCSEHEAATIMQGVLDFLVECHRRHICYGDLKPANIMFSGSAQHQQLQVRAIDFGCSRSSGGRALTQACGSPLYAAPEIATQRYGVGVDVWSAGVLVSTAVHAKCGLSCLVGLLVTVL